MPYQSRFFPATGTKNSAGNSRKAVQTSPQGMDTCWATSPTIGPPMICPKESSCPLVEKTVARIFSSTWSFIQAASTGSLMVRISPASRNTNNMNQKLRPTAKRTRHRIYPALVDMTTLVRLTVPFFSMRAMSN